MGKRPVTQKRTSREILNEMLEDPDYGHKFKRIIKDYEEESKKIFRFISKKSTRNFLKKRSK